MDSAGQQLWQTNSTDPCRPVIRMNQDARLRLPIGPWSKTSPQIRAQGKSSSSRTTQHAHELTRTRAHTQVKPHAASRGGGRAGCSGGSWESRMVASVSKHTLTVRCMPAVFGQHQAQPRMHAVCVNTKTQTRRHAHAWVRRRTHGQRSSPSHPGRSHNLIVCVHHAQQAADYSVQYL